MQITRLFLSQDVEPASPAALAGLQPYTDYIVGSDQILQEVGHVFLQAVIAFLPARCRGWSLYKSNCVYVTFMGVVLGEVDVYDRCFPVEVNILFFTMTVKKKKVPLRIKTT